MAKKKAFIPLLYLTSIVFLPWCISFIFNKILESWITNWWNTRQSENFLNIIQEKSNQELIILNSWVQEFLYNLSDTIKAFSILLLTDLCIGFHSTHGWELMIGSVYKDFGFAQNDQIISGLVSTFPVILDTILKYLIFRYLNRVSPSLVVIYHSMND
ncbi:Chloroplast envelope membrane protein [Lupinus albus]|uniref:Chloroplast envelope membrane protein n=1 Tax=Lupinus albus TaxID=3870 RepID=A0A6A4MX01_LUPAL|nr:Chloroplast envelope membrane protein [Lupinus albus]